MRIDYVLIFAASILFVLLWFHQNVLLIGGDFMLPLNPFSTLQREMSYWNQWIGTGSSVPPLVAGSPPLIDTFFYSALSALGLSLSISQRAYLTISAFVGALSIYTLVKSLPSDNKNLRTAGLFGAIFYLFSPWPLNSGFPSLPLYFHFATMAFLVSLAIFALGLRKSRLHYGLLLGPICLIAFQVLTAVPLFMTLGAMIIVAFIASYLWREYGKASFKPKTIFVCKYLAVTVASIAATSLYWFFVIWDRWPTFQSALVLRPASNDLSLSSSTTLLNGMRLLGNWAFYSRTYVPYAGAYLDSWVLMVLTLFPAVVGFASLLLSPRDRAIIVLNILAVTTLLLAAAGDPLVGFISNSLVASSWFFRFEAGGFPFYLTLLLEYAILVGVSSSQIAHFLDGRPSLRPSFRHAWRVVTVCLILSVILVNSWPYVTGAVLENWYRPSSTAVSIPSQYAAANRWLDNNGGDSRVMMVPPLGSYVATSWGYQGTSSFYSAILDNPLITGSSLAYFSTSNNLIDYTYGFINFGLPLSLTSQIANTNSTSGWVFGTSQIAAVDRLSVEQSSKWDTGTALTWDVNLDETTPNGHQIAWTFSEDQNWSSYSGISLQVAGNYTSSDFKLGIGASDGTVGWLTVDSGLMSNSSEGVRTMVLKLTGNYPQTDLSRVRALILRHDVSAFRTGWSQVLVSDIQLAKPTYRLNEFNKVLSVLNVGYTMFDSSLDSKLYPELNADSYAKFYTQNGVYPNFSQGSIRIFSNNETLGPVFSPSHIVQLGTLAELSSLLSDPSFDPRTSSFIIGQLDPILQKGLADASFGRVQIDFSRTGLDYRVKAMASGPFVLVLSETFDNGWVATADNQILRNHFVANGYANGWLVQNGGAYDITISYLGNNRYSVALSVSYASGLILILAFVVIERNRRLQSRLKSASL